MKLSLVTLPDLEQINSPTGRSYKTPQGNIYPSVTTVLSSLGKEQLEAWRNIVGHEEADRIGKSAADRGTLVHACCENYILGRPNKFDMFQQDARDMFTNLIPYLDKFQEVYALEQRVYSDKLRVAGTIDCVVKIDGKNYLVDFKTSSRLKCRDDIHSYFLQTSAYAIMFYERTGILVPNIKILMTTPDGVLEFDESVRYWIPKFIELRNNYDI